LVNWYCETRVVAAETLDKLIVATSAALIVI
jgi:hypothetical protein